ncbi:MAG TPA: trypsin-like peptidase domain-containing protein [Puia sp.]|nr:trypsin-like peptidase domain-containing protein [Puia sp.]
MRPKLFVRPMDLVAVPLISAATVLVVMWGTDGRRMAFGGLRGGHAGAASVRPVDYRGAAGAGPADLVDAAGAGLAGLVDAAGPVDLVDAAKAVVPATVHVVAGGRDLQSVSSGSGAIISQDGYIVTNNHVIDGAGSIMVTLSNRKTLRATLIGNDPTTDLAVLKIDAANLPFLVYGNSDDARVGQWVLAVGYPLYLQVTATAGIISAIGRDLGGSLGQWSTHIDSFIQTDAAVNLGNSGGPLVNPAGQLIGINTAMASPNGAYTGYSFAIPVRVVRRVVNELIAHGAVRKG